MCVCVCARDLTAHTIDITDDGESAEIVSDLGTSHHNKNTLYVLKTKRENILKLNENLSYYYNYFF